MTRAVRRRRRPSPRPAVAARRLAARPAPATAAPPGLLLAGPVGWLGIAYLGSLLILFLNAFWQRDAFTGSVDPRVHARELRRASSRTRSTATITLRTIAMAAAVTVTCAVIAFPIAYYMARVASPRARGLLVVAVVMPLWASYLVKVYAWRLILAEDGVLNWVLEPFGLKGPGWATSPCASCSSTSGCRT